MNNTLRHSFHALLCLPLLAFPIVYAQTGVPRFAVTPSQVDFGNVVTHSTRLDSSVVVRNNGGGRLIISTVVSSDTQFAISPRTAAIDSGKSRRFTVSFTPDALGNRSSSIIFAHNAAGSPDTIIALGRGVVTTFSVVPTSLAFGDVRVGTNKRDSVRVRNEGMDTLRITPAASDTAQFRIEPSKASIPRNSETIFRVTFSPRAAASVSSTIRLDHNTVGLPTSIPVSGRGLGAIIAITPQTLPFGNVRVGNDRLDTVTVRNTGTDTLIVRNASVSDSRFSVVPGTARIPASGIMGFRVTFAPTTLGSANAALRFDHNAPDSSSTVDLSGTGAAPALLFSASLVSFGAVPLGNSANGRIDLINSGNASLTIDSVRIRGVNASEFSITGSRGPFLLEPGNSAGVFLRFTPQTVGENKSALLIVNGDMPTTPDTVSLLGSGRDALVQVAFNGDSTIGGRLAVSVTAPAGFSATRGALFYRLAGKRAYDSLALSQSAQSFTGAFPESVLTPRGIEYFVRLVGAQGTITNPGSDPVNNPAVFRVGVPRLFSTQRFSPREYRMISIPLELRDSLLAVQLTDDYGPYNPIRWRLFRWENNTYVEFPEIRKNFSPGIAFWLVTQSGLGFDAREARSVPSREPFPLRLEPGWNQIASPFAFSVDWRNILNSNLVRPPFFFDGVEFVPKISTLNPWEGYFVLNDSSQAVTLFVPSVEASSIPKEPSQLFTGGERDYILQFSATAGPARDTYNYVGFVEGASAGDDRLDLPEPPSVSGNFQLSLIAGGKRYVADFRPLSPDGQTWELRATALSPDQAVRVVLSETGVLPSNFKLYILDKDEFASVVVRDNSFAFQSREAVRSFKIIVGTESYAQQASEGISLQPVEYSLLQNYPNPFNPSTTIRYSIQKLSGVTLEIFNILGERVRTLVRSEQIAGVYSVTWDGATDAGSAASSGVYLYRLQAGEFRASKKLVVIH